jgi:hypothetical protein
MKVSGGSDSHDRKPLEREVRRYAAYFRGWCQAFGEHEAGAADDDAISWLVAEQQVGIILPRPVTRALYREALRGQRAPPLLTISPRCLEVGAFHYPFGKPLETHFRDALRDILQTPHDLHLYLTYHFTYPSGTRIITLSRNKPLHIIYKEFGLMHIGLLPGNGNGPPPQRQPVRNSD